MVGRIGNFGGWLALAGSAAFTCTTARASPPLEPPATTGASIAAPVGDEDDGDETRARSPATGTPPRDLALRFWLEPSDAGTRTLVLRDGDDLRLEMGQVEPGWACDTSAEMIGSEGDRVMTVACGGGALRAQVVLGYEHRRAGTGRIFDITLTASSSTGVHYVIPREEGGQLALDPQLVDPSPGCDAAGKETIDISADEVLAAGEGPGSAPERRLLVRSPSVPIDSTVHVYEGERCSVKRDRAGTMLVATCAYTDQPHEDLVVLRVRDGALLWTEVDDSPCSGRTTVYGGWRLACDATVRWPSKAKMARAGDGDFVGWEAPNHSYGVHFSRVEYEP